MFCCCVCVRTYDTTACLSMPSGQLEFKLNNSCILVLVSMHPGMQGRCSVFLCSHNFLRLFDMFVRTISEGSFGRHIEMAFTEVSILR